MNNIREYSGYFTFSELSAEKHESLVKIFDAEGLDVDLSRRSLEFESTGRDDDRLVLKVFKKVAEVLKVAEGELRCEIDDEQDDPYFEFFTIKEGKLLLQSGRIVRENKFIVV